MPKRKTSLKTRQHILKAAEELLRTQGLAGVTTRAIAQQVGCSEGALYVHFKGRLTLLVAVLEECLPSMLGPLVGLDHAVGQNSPADNLENAIKGIYRFQRRVAPIFGSLFAEPALLKAYQRALQSKNRGPHRAVARIASYIEAEQQLGRLAIGIDPHTAASILMSSCFWRAFTEQFLDTTVAPAWPAFSKALVAAAVGPHHAALNK
jgi:AcrR family transcriptional regulator